MDQVDRMKRSEKTRSVTRFLTGASGIPLISWDGSSLHLDAPAPYKFVVSTDATAWRFFAHVKDLPQDGIPAVIRYDKFLDNINDAVVGMKLPTFTTLLSAHYATISDRITNQIKGD